MGELAAFLGGAIGTILLPGAALFEWLVRSRRPAYPALHRIGMGLACQPLLFLLADMLHVRIGFGFIIGVTVGSFLLLVLRLLLDQRNKVLVRPLAGPPFDSYWKLALFIGVFMIHWVQLHRFSVLPGVDGFEHALIAKLMQTSGGIPHDYLPFVPLTSFSYHFGVHADVVAVSILTRLTPQRVLLLAEPALLALIAVTTSNLALSLGSTRGVSALAGLMTGVVSTFPAWLENWARIPQLAGTALLLIVVTEILSWPARSDLRPWPTLALLVAGLSLTHYRMTLLLIYAVLATSILWVQSFSVGGARDRLRDLAKTLGLATLLVSPWIFHLFSLANLSREARPGGPGPEYFYSLARLGPAGTEWPTLVIPTLALCGLIFLIVTRRTGVAFVVWWLLIMFAFSNPYVVPLPWSGLADLVTVVSSVLYPLLCVLAAETFGGIRRFLIATESATAALMRRVAFPVVVFGLVLGGGIATVHIVKPQFVYVHAPDVAALRWLAVHSPADALVASSAYIDTEGIIEPTDAGAWTSYLSNRRQTIPPLVARNEARQATAYRSDEELARSGRTIWRRSGYRLLRRAGVQYVFVGTTSSFSVRGLNSSDRYFRPIYGVGGARIYCVRSRPAAPCGGVAERSASRSRTKSQMNHRPVVATPPIGRAEHQAWRAFRDVGGESRSSGVDGIA